MKYVSIDIETTGLDPEMCDIIEFGAVIDNLWEQPPLGELPTFHRLIYQPSYRGQAFALGQNGHIFKKIANKEGEITVPENLMSEFHDFIIQHAPELESKRYEVTINVAGKNFANFDANFIKHLPVNDFKRVKFHHRTFDPVMLYLDRKLDASSKVLPGSQECMKRAGLMGEVAHTALEDAFMVVKLLRAKFPMN